MNKIIVVPLFYSFSELHIIPYTCLYKRNFIRISTYDAPTRQNGRQTRVRLRVQWATPLPARQCRVLFFFFFWFPIRADSRQLGSTCTESDQFALNRSVSAKTHHTGAKPADSGQNSKKKRCKMHRLAEITKP